jgi:hypothetical protein
LISGGGKEEKEGEKEEGEDEVVMNNLMHDIKEGFIQRRLPDGGFKVHNFKTSNSKIMRLRSCAPHEFRCAAYHCF